MDPNKSYGFNKNKPIQESVLFKNELFGLTKEGVLTNTDVIISNGKIIAVGTLLNPFNYFKEGEFKTQMHLLCILRVVL